MVRELRLPPEDESFFANRAVFLLRYYVFLNIFVRYTCCVWFVTCMHYVLILFYRTGTWHDNFIFYGISATAWHRACGIRRRRWQL